MNSRKAINVYKLVVLFLMIGLMTMYPVAAAEAMIWTDKTDYAPEETVLISGSGFNPNTQLTKIDITRPTSPEPTIDSCSALPTTDEEGSFFNYPYLLDGIIGTYTIDASDGSTSAQTTFTDDRHINSAKLDGASSVIVTPSTSITAAVTVQLTGGDNWNSTKYTIEGQTAVCVDTPNHSSGTNTESFSITAPSTPGIYDVTFVAYQNDDCSGGSSSSNLADGIRVIQPNPTLSSSCGIDMVLIIDSSGSIDNNELTTMKNAFKGFVDAFLPYTPTQIAVVDFDTTAHTVYAYNSNGTTIKNEIDTASSGGSTNWDDALAKAYALFDHSAKPDLYVFASDGNPNKYGAAQGPGNGVDSAALNAAITRANSIKSSGIRIITLGIGDELKPANLQAISSADAYYSTGFDTLAQTLAALAKDICGGTISVKKLVDGQPATGWQYNVSVTGGSSIPTSSTTDASGFIDPVFAISCGATANVIVTETAKEGYGFVSASCVDQDQQSVGSCSNGICTFSIDPTDAIYCEFQNTYFHCTENAQCDDGQYCNGIETCNLDTHNCLAGTQIDCSASSDQCNTGVCNEESDQCGKQPKENGLSCNGSPSGDCDLQDTCQSGSCINNVKPALTSCRTSAGICDVAETCTGNSADCPTDAFMPSTYECRAKNGVCDIAEFCTGSSAECPADAHAVDITGPVTSHTTVIPSYNNGLFNISADANDTCSNIAEAKYFVGYLNPASCSGTGYNMPIKDGTPDSPNEALFVSGVEYAHDGLNWACVKSKDALGNWGNCDCVYFEEDAIPPSYPFDISLNGHLNPQEYLVCGQNPWLNASVCDVQSYIQGGEYFIDLTIPPIPAPWTGNWMNVLHNFTFNGDNCAVIGALVNVSALSDGTHTIRIRGKDSVENWGKIENSPTVSFIKDTTAPSTSKQLLPYGDVSVPCELTSANGHDLTNGCAYVKPGTQIILNAADPDVSQTGEFAGNVIINYKVYWSYNGTSWTLDQSGSSNVNQPITITLNSDSYHLVEYWSTDSCSNVENKHYELDIVDSQPPVITKSIGSPKVVNGDNTYVTQQTPITVTAVDPQPHPVGGVTVNCGWNWTDGTASGTHEAFVVTEPFTYTEDSWHTLHCWATDALGNRADMYEDDIVDTAAPEVSKIVGTPKIESTQITEYNVPEQYGVKDTAWYITQATTITLSCTDVQPHPVGGEKIFYKYYVDGVLHTAWTEYTVPITYDEDTYHEFYYYCVDALGNKGDTHYELDMVDTAAPSTTVNIEGPMYYDEITHKTYLDGVTKVVLTCTDAEPHPVGVDKIKYRYFVDGQLVQDWVDYTYGETGFSFPEESNHTLDYYCTDLLGNTESVQSKIYYVDHTKPITSLAFGTPYFTNGVSEWITSNATITLTATDGIEVHDSGVAATKYRVTLMEGNEQCLSATACQEAEGRGDFTTYSLPFTVAEDSCHLIEYYSYDHVAKTEVTNKKCVFVDNTKPITTKTVGDPKISIAGTNGYIISDHATITLSCANQMPHPVGGERIYWQWQYSTDGEHWGEWSAQEEYTAPIIFDESSFHRMKYWCVDALGNTEEFHTELDAVDATPPVSTISAGTPQYIDAQSITWITQATPVSIECTDVEPHISGKDFIKYRYYVDGVLHQEWTTYEGPFSFNEDSNHTIEYYCVDKMGNVENTKTQLYKVDTRGPTVLSKFVIRNGVRFDEIPGQNVTIGVQTGDKMIFCANVEDYKLTNDIGVGVKRVNISFSDVEDPDLAWNADLHAYCVNKTANWDCGWKHFYAQGTDWLNNKGAPTDGITFLIDNVKPVGMVLNPHAGNSYYAGKVFSVYAPAVDFGGVDQNCDSWNNCPASGVAYCDLYAVDYKFENLDQYKIRECYDDLLKYLLQIGAIAHVPHECISHSGSYELEQTGCYEALMNHLMAVPENGTAYVEYIGRVPYQNGVCKGYATISANTNLTDSVFLAWKIVDNAENGNDKLHLALNPFDSDWELNSEQACNLAMRGTPITMDVYNKGNVVITELAEDTTLTSGDNITVSVSISDSSLPDDYYRNCEAVIEKYEGEGNMSVVSHQFSSHIAAGEPGIYTGSITSTLPDYAHITSGNYKYTVKCYINNVLAGSDWFDFKVDNEKPVMKIVYPHENATYSSLMPVSLHLTDGTAIAPETVKVRMQEKGKFENLWCMNGGCEDSGWITLNSAGNGIYSKMINISVYNFTGGKYTFDAVACDVLYTVDSSDETGLGFNMLLDRNALHCRKLSVNGAEKEERPACSDGIDNDADGLIDFPADSGCYSAADTDENAVCGNGHIETGEECDGEENCSEQCTIIESGGQCSVDGPHAEWAIFKNGYYWAWASPCDGGCSNIEPIKVAGWRYATPEEWAMRPAVTDFGTYENFKCASPYFDPNYTHCDYNDAVSGHVTSSPTGDAWETWLIYDCGVA